MGRGVCVGVIGFSLVFLSGCHAARGYIGGPRDLVTVANQIFAPSTVFAQPGETVTFTDTGEMPYHIIQGRPLQKGRPLFEVTLQPGQSFRWRVSPKLGRIPFYSDSYPDMHGNIIVAANGGN